MSGHIDRRTIVIVDDDHTYKAILAGYLKEFDVRFWGCRGKCEICNADQPFKDAVDFIRSVAAESDSRLAAIVLDVNEFQNDEHSIKEILPVLEKDPLLRPVPVIAYSVRHLPGQDRRAMERGAVRFYDRTKTTPRQAAEIIRQYAL